jgi:hypothetical protein
VSNREQEMISQTLDALERIMRMFQAERIVYLLGAATSLGLLLYAAFLMISSGKVDASQLGLIFGAGGLTTVCGARVVFFLNKAFNLIEEVIRKLFELGPSNED